MSDKRKKYQFYKSNKKQRNYNVENNLKGFLCSCNNREKDCIRETYNLLNKYADQLYPEEEKVIEKTSNSDIDEDFTKELEQLKTENQKPSLKRFQVVESGAKNFLFIRTTLDNPVELCTKVVTDILESGTQQTRFLLRLVPVEVTCKAYLDDIKTALQPLLEKHFKGTTKTFSVFFNHRNNNCLKRDDVIKEAAAMVSAISDDHKVNLKEAEITIVIEVIKGFAFMAVVPDYMKHKKFNLHMLCENKEGEPQADVLGAEETDCVQPDENASPTEEDTSSKADDSTAVEDVSPSENVKEENV